MIELLSDNRAVILLLLTVILGAAGYILRQHVSTVKKLDAEALRQKDLVEMKQERDRLHRENAVRLDAIHATVAATSKSISDMGILSHRMDAVEKDVQALRDFKHDYCEPAVRYIGHLQAEKPWAAAMTHMERLESKVDANEQKASDSRHMIANNVQVILSEIQSLKKL